MDAAIASIEDQPGEMEFQVREQADSYLASLHEARVAMKNASSQAVEQGASAFPVLNEEGSSIWNGFKNAQEKPSEIADLHEVVLSAQVKERLNAWRQLLDGYWRSIASAEDEFRAGWFQRFEDVWRERTQRHACAAANSSSRWSAIYNAMKQVREAVERATAGFRMRCQNRTRAELSSRDSA